MEQMVKRPGQNKTAMVQVGVVLTRQKNQILHKHLVCHMVIQVYNVYYFNYSLVFF
ncbi:hypothetical protein Hanom_Chr12g01145331 [Helianthus anomalus]